MGWTGTDEQKLQYDRTSTGSSWRKFRGSPPTTPNPETRQIRRRRQRPWLSRNPPSARDIADRRREY